MPGTRQAILAATLMQPDRAWYAADLAGNWARPAPACKGKLAELVNVASSKAA